MSNKDIKIEKNGYEGKRIFFIGNGPSLSKTPLDQLESEYTIGVNKIYKKFGNTNWRPDFYLLMHSSNKISNWNDGDVALKEIKKMAESGVLCILYSDLKDIVGAHPKIHYLDRSDLNNTLFDSLGVAEIEEADSDLLHEFWSDDINMFVYAYHSAYIMYQVCSYLGFDEVILVGCDLGFEYVNPHMVFDNGLDPFRFNGDKWEYLDKSIDGGVVLESMANGLLYKSISLMGRWSDHLGKVLPFPDMTGTAHFTDEYWNRGLHIKDNKELERQILREHAVAKEICSDKGMKISNGTIGGELELFPRVELDRIVADATNRRVG